MKGLKKSVEIAGRIFGLVIGVNCVTAATRTPEKYPDIRFIH